MWLSATRWKRLDGSAGHGRRNVHCKAFPDQELTRRCLVYKVSSAPAAAPPPPRRTSMIGVAHSPRCTSRVLGARTAMQPNTYHTCSRRLSGNFNDILTQHRRKMQILKRRNLFVMQRYGHGTKVADNASLFFEGAFHPHSNCTNTMFQQQITIRSMQTGSTSLTYSQPQVQGACISTLPPQQYCGGDSNDFNGENVTLRTWPIFRKCCAGSGADSLSSCREDAGRKRKRCTLERSTNRRGKASFCRGRTRKKTRCQRAKSLKTQREKSSKTRHKLPTAASISFLKAFIT